MKKLLALVLALVMTLSLCVTSNAAFADAADITHGEAVEVMNALGVINGKGDNKFDPKGNVTRAEMAKMITIVALGDVDISAFVGTATDLTDISGHWAEGYIKYCYSQGVIAGKGNGIFAPNDNVTAVEAAKMLLVAIGYNATVQGYVGADWAINVVRDAQLSGFYAELKGLTSGKVLSRDEAAQMIWNAVQARLIVKEPTLNITTGTIAYNYRVSDNANDTLLHETFGAVAKQAYLVGISYNTTDKDYDYTFKTDNTFNGTAIKDTVKLEDADLNVLSSKTDYSALFGQKVTIVYKNGASTQTVYGIYSEAKVIATGTIGQISGVAANGAIASTDKKIKLDDTKLDLGDTANAVEVYAFNNSGYKGNVYQLQTNATYFNKYDGFVAYDNDADGKTDTVVWNPLYLAKVTYVSKSTINLSYVQPTARAANVTYSYNTDDACFYENGTGLELTFPEGVAKNDYLVVTKDVVTNTAMTAVVAETLTGKVTGAKASALRIDGTWYDIGGVTGCAVDSKYKFQLVNGYLAEKKLVESTTKDLFMLIASDVGNSIDNARAKVLFADGTTEVITVNKFNGNTADSGNFFAGANADVGKLFTYTKNSDGTYDVKTATPANTGYHALANVDANALYTKANSDDSASFQGHPIADDAIFFVKSVVGNKTTYSVISGATLKTYNSIGNVASGAHAAFTAGGSFGQYILDTTDGIYGVKAGSFALGADKRLAVSSTYGYIVSAPFEIKEDNVTYAVFDMFTSEGLKEDVKAVVNDSAPVAPAKGVFVKYDVNTDGTYTVSAHDLTPVAITGATGDSTAVTLVTKDGAMFGKAAMLFDSKADRFTVNTDAIEGVAGTDFSIAGQTANNLYYINALAKLDDAGKVVTALIFDINNDLDITGCTGDTTNANGLAGVLVSAAESLDYVKNYSIKINGNAGANDTSNGTDYVVEGNYIKVTFTVNTDLSGGAAKTVNIATTGTGVTAKDVDVTIPAADYSGAKAKEFTGYVELVHDNTTTAFNNDVVVILTNN